MSLPIGELAALGTSLSWTVSTFAFESAAKRLGPLAMNFVRVSFAFSMLTVVATLLRGAPLPTDANASQLGWLLLSGVVGLVLGDQCLFHAYLAIGARRAMLVQTTAPVFTALIGWLALGETPRLSAALGTALVLAGVAWAIHERATKAGAAGEGGSGRTAFGLVMALGGALGQAGGLVLSKLGMDGYHPVAATQVRMVAGIAGFAVLLTAARAWSRVRSGWGDRKGVGATALGAFFGPTIGVSLSLTAVAHTQAGVAAALMATQQVWMAGATVALGRERLGLGAFAGAALAVIGVVVLVAL